MTSPPPPADGLERIVARVLRTQPLRRAPITLETRVLAELERRATLPWWRKSFLHWPTAARIAFLLASAGFVKIAFTLATWTVAAVGSAQGIADATPIVAWTQAIIATAHAAQEVAALIVHSIAPLWRYGALALVFAMYAVVFGVGAMTYRTLVHKPPRASI